MATKTEFLILGGGITGLAAAMELQKYSIKPMILTKNFGGLITNYSSSGFYFDYGGHVYATQDPNVNIIMAAVGAEKHERKAFYQHGKDLVPYPVQDYVDQLGSRIDGLEVPYESGMTFAEWAFHTFGPDFYNGFLEPFNKRIWTIDPIKMDADWIASRVKKPTEEKEKWGPNSEFWYARGEEIVRYMLRRLRNNGLKTRKGHIINIDLKSRKVRYVSSNRNDAKTYYIHFDFLINTLPICRLHENFETHTYVLSNRIRSFGVGLKTTLDMDFHWLYCDINREPHRVTLLSRYAKDNAPPGKDSLLIEFPYRLNYKAPSPLIGKWMPGGHITRMEAHRGDAARALKAAGFGFIREKDIETATVADTMGYPIPSLDIRKFIAAIKVQLFAQHVVTCGRWGSHAYLNIDHCINDARAAVRALWEDYMDNEYMFSSHYYGHYNDNID